MVAVRNRISDTRTGIYLEHATNDSPFVSNQISRVGTGINVEWRYDGVGSNGNRFSSNRIAEAANAGIFVDTGLGHEPDRAQRVRRSAAGGAISCRAPRATASSATAAAEIRSSTSRPGASTTAASRSRGATSSPTTGPRLLSAPRRRRYGAAMQRRRDVRKFGRGPYVLGLRRVRAGRGARASRSRCRRSKGIEGLDLGVPVTLLAGDNGTGKSTVVEAVAGGDRVRRRGR